MRRMAVSGRFVREPRNAEEFLQICEVGGLNPMDVLGEVRGLDHIIDEWIAMPKFIAQHGCKLLHTFVRFGRVDCAQKLVNAGVDFRQMDLPHRGTIVHAALYYSTDNWARHDVVNWALDTYPEAINIGEPRLGDTPLVMAIAVRPNDIGTIQLLIHRGANVKTASVHRFGNVDKSLVSYAWSRPKSPGQCGRLRSLLIAYGARIKEGEAPLPCYDQTLAANEKCRSVAWTILGLRHMRGRVMGNGRDALKLIAREVWLSRMDEGWF